MNRLVFPAWLIAIVSWTLPVLAAMPQPDRYDKAIERYARTSGQRMREKQVVFSGKVLDDIRSRFGKSLQLYRQYVFAGEKVNILTFEDEAAAQATISQFPAAGQHVALRDGRTVIEIVYTDLSRGVEIWSYLQQDALVLQRIVRHSSRGIKLVKVARLDAETVGRVSTTLGFQCSEIYNCVCVVNDKVVQLNYVGVRGGTTREQIVGGFAGAGTSVGRLVVDGEVAMEVVGRDFGEGDVREVGSAIGESALNSLVDRAIAPHAKIEKARYYASGSQHPFDGLRKSVKSAVELTLVCGNSAERAKLVLVELNTADVEEALAGARDFERIGDQRVLVCYVADKDGAARKLVERYGTPSSETAGSAK